MNRNMEFLQKNIAQIEEKIHYVFKDKKHLILALTHSSYANENKNERLGNNERLEFLGDAILNLIISEKIYMGFKGLTEGEMTKARANIVCEQSLIKCSNEIGLGKYLLLGKGEELTGGRERISILSDAFEALLGAIYLDSGMENAKEFVYRYMDQLIKNSACGTVSMDFKTQLQELVQKSGENKIVYEIVDEKGPDHSKIFVSSVKVGDKIFGLGEGRSKKEAEQNAAKAAVESFSV